MMSALQSVTREEVRRLALSRQHLDGRFPPPMLDVIRDLGCVQLDPIRAVERTHRLVLWSRLGQFDPGTLTQLRFHERALFEYWAHAASLVLTEEYPAHAWQMRQYRNAADYPPWFEAHRDAFLPMLDEIRAQLREGPRLSREIELDDDELRQQGRWWSGRYVGRLLSFMWTRGEVMVYGRSGNQRLWGLADAFWPEWTPQQEWDAAQVTTFAVQKAIRALGVATSRQIKLHYTRHRYPQLEETLQRLLQDGVLEEVTVPDDTGSPLPGPWYLHAADLSLLESIRAGAWQGDTTLLSPFDNLICDRDRTELLFDFEFRIEIYVPKAKRQYGYYVLPILHQDRLIGRVDPKMDRRSGTLHVYNVYAEATAPDDAATVTAVGAAVADLARFLGAKKIDWGDVPPQWGRLPHVAG